ncbi:MotE family protein [Bacillus alkalicellulosilyticus]|uniref:MotE family protein n=1 Tax=Alkalihalobacterium alkalicellulosilyticum TaxID=1912214 RepID=UPI000998450E|nr:hypothetical protein [Bacillus alkalicellulosilyticus]
MSENQKEYGKFQVFFFVIFIPCCFLIILFFSLSSLLGYNTLGKAKEVGAKIPYISTIIGEEVEGTEDDEMKVDDLLASILEKEAVIEELEAVMEAKNDKIAKIEEQNKILEQKLELKDKEPEVEKDEPRKDLEDIGKTYQAMSAKNAAAILEQLPLDQTLLHLSQVPVAARAAILTKMETEKAAEIMANLTDQ